MSEDRIGPSPMVWAQRHHARGAPGRKARECRRGVADPVSEPIFRKESRLQETCATARRQSIMSRKAGDVLWSRLAAMKREEPFHTIAMSMRNKASRLISAGRESRRVALDAGGIAAVFHDPVKDLP